MKTILYTTASEKCVYKDELENTQEADLDKLTGEIDDSKRDDRELHDKCDRQCDGATGEQV